MVASSHPSAFPSPVATALWAGFPLGPCHGPRGGSGVRDRLYEAICTAGYLGRIPRMPGTAEAPWLEAAAERALQKSPVDFLFTHGHLL